MNINQTMARWEIAIQARDFSQGQRKKLAKSGAALPGGGFPIVNKHDLKNAERAIGRAKNPGAARAHIRTRAKALHVKLSKNWHAASLTSYENFTENVNDKGMHASAPPGCESMVRALKKTASDEASAFKIAWAHYNKYGTCGKTKEK